MNDVPGKPQATDGGEGGDQVRLTARVSGLVQGVGFRDYVRSRGRRLGLVGSATNLPDGRVEVVAEGPEPACQRLLDMLTSGHTPGRTDGVEHAFEQARGGLAGFVRR
jgi:acylphosphatase